jgi:hypothetical protein
MSVMTWPVQDVPGDRDDNGGQGVIAYRPMTLVAPAGHLAGESTDPGRWRLIAEFLEEYRHEPRDVRAQLLATEPGATSDERWDVFLAALAEHLAARDGRGVGEWARHRQLRVSWFPFSTPAARADALHSPASFGARGIFIAPQNLEVA